MVDFPKVDLNSTIEASSLEKNASRSSSSREQGKSTVTHRHRHGRWVLSEITLPIIEQSYPDLFHAINSELPWTLIHSWRDGLTFSKRIFMGMKRNGPDYVMRWINENHLNLSMNAILIVNCLTLHRSWITYDMLFEYLRTHNAGELTMDKHFCDLSKVPAYTEKEERALRLAPIEEAEEKQRVAAHEEALKRRRLISSLEDNIKFQEGELRDYEEIGDEEQIKYFKDLIASNKQRLEAEKRELNAGSGLI